VRTLRFHARHRSMDCALKERYPKGHSRRNLQAPVLHGLQGRASRAALQHPSDARRGDWNYRWQRRRAESIGPVGVAGCVAPAAGAAGEDDHQTHQTQVVGATQPAATGHRSRAAALGTSDMNACSPRTQVESCMAPSGESGSASRLAIRISHLPPPLPPPQLLQQQPTQLQSRLATPLPSTVVEDSAVGPFVTRPAASTAAAALAQADPASASPIVVGSTALGAVAAAVGPALQMVLCYDTGAVLWQNCSSLDYWVRRRWRAALRPPRCALCTTTKCPRATVWRLQPTQAAAAGHATYAVAEPASSCVPRPRS
jgi:hypothetical protein